MGRNGKIISLIVEHQFPSIKERPVYPSDGHVVPSDKGIAVEETAFELEFDLLAVKVLNVDRNLRAEGEMAFDFSKLLSVAFSREYL